MEDVFVTQACLFIYLFILQPGQKWEKSMAFLLSFSFKQLRMDDNGINEYYM